MSSLNWPTSVGLTKLNQIIAIATGRLPNSVWQEVLNKAIACKENEDHTVAHESSTDAQLEASVSTAKDFAAGGRAGQCSGELDHPGVGGDQGTGPVASATRKGGKKPKKKPFKKKTKKPIKQPKKTWGKKPK